jgi:hypothetical protein
MTDPRDPNDPVYRNTADESLEDKSNRWGVIVGVMFLMIVAGVALGVGHKPGQLGSNDTKPPVAAFNTSG